MATNTIQSFGGDIDIGSNLTVNTNTFHVDSVSGRVGIGKTNPAYVLDVGGILNASSIYKGGTPLIGSPWTTAGNVIYRASGNTGIGTNNPQQALEIYDGALRISNTSNSSNVEMYGSRDWYEQAGITASNGTSSDYFGYSVAISSDGNTVIVGAYGVGYAYIRTRTGTTWSSDVILYASDRVSGENFGYNVAISEDGNTALVGAYTANSQGAAYVYVKPGGGWSNVTETAKLTASDKAASDNFGISVSISGDGNTALVGAYDEDYLASASGSAYLYFKPGSGWSNVTETTKLTASDPQSSDNFGRAVAISGNGTTAIIGAPNEDTIASNAGKAYIFEGRNVLHIGGSLNYTGSIISFTGQHICFPYGNIEQGLVVSSNQNKYMNLNGKLTTGLNAITSSESLPIVSLSNIAYDKSVFGVVDNVEAIGSTTRTSEYTKGPKELGDNRVIVNSVGEGALWVVNTNGPLIAGDYITTSNIVGYGQKQDDDTIKNYTVAKITMDCDFNPPDQPIQIIKKDENGINVLDEYGRLQWEDSEKTEKMYSLRYLTIDGVQTDQANVVWTAAYVGCTYHCG